MKILVDTSIWSLALRRKKSNINDTENELLNDLIELIEEKRIVIIGPIKQEILSGISSKNQFDLLQEKLLAFKSHDITDYDYLKAAEFFNVCRVNGIQGSHIDFLICAVAYNNNYQIFTTDKDFENYSKHIELNIFKNGQQ